MNVMGLTDPETEAVGAGVGDCPIADSELEFLVTASRHTYFSSIQREELNNGYILVEELNLMLAGQAPSLPVSQCECVAHERIKVTASEVESDDLKSLIRSDSMKKVLTLEPTMLLLFLGSCSLKWP